MDKIGNLKREKKVFRSRVIFSVVIMLSMTLILTLRLFNLQITKHDFYVEEALGNQMQNLPITPIRGDILDRNGKISTPGIWLLTRNDEAKDSGRLNLIGML